MVAGLILLILDIAGSVEELRRAWHRWQDAR
jgi:hypothetical protein